MPEVAASRDSRGRAKQKINKWGPIPKTTTHNIFTHFPKDKDCPICNQTKVQRAQCRQSSGQPDGLPEPKKFGQALTADHAIINEIQFGCPSVASQIVASQIVASQILASQILVLLEQVSGRTDPTLVAPV